MFCVLVLSLTDVQMWRDQTRSPEPTSTPSARRWARALIVHLTFTLFLLLVEQCKSVFAFPNFLCLFLSFPAFSGWHVGGPWEQVYRPGQRLWKSLQNRHQEGRAGARVLQVESKKTHPREQKKVSRHGGLLLIYVCLYLQYVFCGFAFTDFHWFWTKCTHCCRRPNVRLALYLLKTHYHVKEWFVHRLSTDS